MRIATYNVWNSDLGMPLRTNDLLASLGQANADVLCLQEVRSEVYHNTLANALGYVYHVFCEQSELSIMCRYPLVEQKILPYGIIVRFEKDSNSFAVGNIHLPWDSVLKREQESVRIHRTLADMPCDLRLLAGDFNASDRSSVHQFFLGEASLHGEEALPCWYDLAEGYACKFGVEPTATIDFHKNPRWKNEQTIECNQRYDRILLQNPYPKPFPIVNYVKVFGTEVSNETGLCPSDHYGVYADLSVK